MLGMVSYCPKAIMSVRKYTFGTGVVFEIFDFKNVVTLKTRLGSVKVVENVTVR